MMTSCEPCKKTFVKNFIVLRYLLDYIVLPMSFIIELGIFAQKDFQRGEFLLEYAGVCYSKKRGREMEEKYKQDGIVENFLFFCGNYW